MEMIQEIDDAARAPAESLQHLGSSARQFTSVHPAEWQQMVKDDTLDPVDAALRAFQALQAQSAQVSTIVAASIGIGATDLRALLFIASGTGVTPKLTGDYLALSSGAITNLVDRMVAADLVKRTPNPNDRRSLVLELAPRGADAVNRVLDFYRRAFGSSTSDEQLAFVARTFRTISDALARAAAEDVARLQEP
jgi:DNA-binding MarR family transcriptional regulator